MKKGKTGKTAASVVLALAMCLPMAGGLTVRTYAARQSQPVSTGLLVLAAENSMAKAAITGSELKLVRDDFARAMNLSKIDSVTVTRVPEAGELRVGNTVLTGGERIKATDATMLTYVGEGGEISSSFDFRVNDSPVDVTCKLYFLSAVNGTPSLGEGSEGYVNVSTHEDITLYGRLPYYDPEGDETIIEIVSYPETGILTLTDRKTGDYTYTPAAGYTGRDEFRYVARDIYGNYSAARTVSLTVEKSRTALTFSDMTDSPSHSAAISVTEAGIMSAEEVGGKLCFRPEEAVSREDFVVMAMKAVGMKNLGVVDKTVFADDGEISDLARDYVGAAYSLGYIDGELDSEGRLCFAPKRAITRAEAACILVNMIDAVSPTVSMSFSDSEYVPAWAKASLYSLSYMGIIPSDGGNIAPLDHVTRADAARILSAIM